ncbi:NRDE family protein [Inmirania thermothiophila]|uniref:Uncharacterized protein with NRDE domain n=1 Tax=Inmirania thermothiophila TaxID=1750597 RepID=A0A3N1Y7W2_9GAMM|nr:NRDE family protein [Inmirania thermothiophila]ROR34601.1 uncharacterized protein with NRDE domain [Inmirania thermothiophila]
MCLILVAHRAHPRWPLVIAANRDEFRDRPAAPAAWWREDARVLAGRDLAAGGTWLGVRRDGRWAAVTNVREGRRGRHPRSRGELVARYLLGDAPPRAFLAEALAGGAAYGGFNLLVATPDEVLYGSNRGHGIHALAPGVHGLSNGRLDAPWPKVRRGREGLRALLAGEGPRVEALMALLADRREAPPEALPDTGVGPERERRLSPLFIVGADYGTRCSTVLVVDREGRACLVERTWDGRGEAVGECRHEFEIPAFAAGEEVS